jgi:hypothetical protein
MDNGGEMRRAAIGQVVAVDRCDDDVLQPQPRHGVGDAGGFIGIERHRLPGAHIAERAGSGAGVAHDHHGGVALGPAFADIGAGGFLADRVQPVLPHQGAGLVIDRMGGRLDADPGGLALDRVVRAMRLLRVAERGLGPVVDDEVCGSHWGLQVAAGAGGVKRWARVRRLDLGSRVGECHREQAGACTLAESRHRHRKQAMDVGHGDLRRRDGKRPGKYRRDTWSPAYVVATYRAIISDPATAPNPTADIKEPYVRLSPASVSKALIASEI